MAIFNKIGSFARSVSDKTGDKLEISKLKAQIRSNQDDIEELKLKLEYLYMFDIRFLSSPTQAKDQN